MNKTRQKPMTEREKRERARIRAELRAKGVLPPKKKPLDRKAYCEEAREVLTGNQVYELYPYLCWGMMELLSFGKGIKDKGRSPEAVGVAKAIKLGVRRYEFEKERHGESYTLRELCDAVEDIVLA